MKKAFQVKERVFLIIFKGLSIAKTCLKPESAPLNKIVITVLQLLLTVLGKLPLGKFSSGKFPPIKLPSGKSPPRKISTQKIPTWNIPTHFINCLSSLFLHLILRP